MAATIASTSTAAPVVAAAKSPPHHHHHLKHFVHANDVPEPPPVEPCSKDEEAPAGYNSGGYMSVRIGDAFKDGRYVVLRKLGCARPCRHRAVH
jgi:hypothetical protein